MQESNNGRKTAATADSTNEPAKHFPITKQELIDLVNLYKTRTYDEEVVRVQELGGVEGICQKLKVDLKIGLTGEDFPQRTEQFGNNYREPLKAKSWFSLFMGALDDFMLKVLIVASIFSITFDMILAHPEDRSHAWIEGFAIMVAVATVATVGSFVDWKKEVQFVISRAKSDEKNICRVLRKGEIVTIHHNYLHVGDVINIEYGMANPVDGLVFQATQLTVDEAAMTGESDEMKKEIMHFCNLRREEKAAENQKLDEGAKMHRAHEIPSPLILSGTSIAGGEGKMVCLMVGEESCLGQIISKLIIRPEVTPLQSKLEKIATDIGKMGTYIAILIIHVLLFRYFLEGLSQRNTDLFGGESPNKENSELFVDALSKFISYVIVGVAIIVVAVPEGLPLAVMISLAYSIQRMLKDNNDVKRLSSCEIMGGADNICSDKTGTLTLNQMKVTNIWAGKDYVIPQTQDESGSMTKFKWNQFFPTDIHPMHIEHNISCNTAEKAGATDRAMTELLERVECNQESLKDKHLGEHKIRFPFSSKRKRMSTVLENLQTSNSYGKRIHVKGASEIVKNCCSHYLDIDGKVKEMSDEMKGNLDNVIYSYAKQALRTICLAYKDLMPNECGPEHDFPQDQDVKDIEKSGLTLICIFGIMDIVRPEVPGAVLQIQKAGVTVRMVTGDNIVTARAIAVNCNILQKDQLEDERCCMEGPEFYEKMGGLVVRNGKEEVGNFKVFKDLMPYMKVMARSRPEDKYLMVTGLRQMGCTVAVTGDGTNDAPALKKADVGFAMGKTGTDVCKEAADILITDDNFSSIVKACMWGRNVFDNIKRFLQFQLTVNVGACIITFIGAIIGKESPLQPIQLLWVNLIMDSLASLALATELPKPSLLERMPQNREDYIVSRKMVKHILGQAIWQCIVLFFFLFAGEFVIPESVEKYQFKKSGYVFPGRANDWDGNDLYTKAMMEELGAPRHLTFIFNTFVLMQIFNMLCSRKIYDEWNFLEGLHKNVTFIILWFVIIGGQILITEFGSRVFVVSPDGLDGTQWAISFGVGLTSIVNNAFLKLIPDWCCPKLGNDSVDDRRKQAALQAKNL